MKKIKTVLFIIADIIVMTIQVSLALLLAIGVIYLPFYLGSIIMIDGILRFAVTCLFYVVAFCIAIAVLRFMNGYYNED